MHKQQGWLQAWEYCQEKPIQTLRRASQGVNWSWSQCIKSHHAQTSSGKELPSHFWNRNIVRSILPGLRRKRTGLLLSGPKSSFQMKVNFAFRLEIKVPESGGREERHRIQVAWVQCEVYTVSDDLGCHVICWCWSTVFWSQCSIWVFTVNAAIYQEILEHFMLPSADKIYGDADFIFQQDLAPAHTAKDTKSWFNDHCAWLASKLAWPEPNRESMGYCQEEDERHQIQQCRWPEGCFQNNLGSITLSSATNWSPPCSTALMK